MADEVTRFEIAKLELRKGDTVIVRTDLHLSREQAMELRRRVKECVPDGVPVMVLTSDVSLEVLRDQRE